MNYRIETNLDPSRWNAEVLQAFKKAALEVKAKLIKKKAEEETSNLLNRLNVKSHRTQHHNNNAEPNNGHRTEQQPSNGPK